MVSTNQTSVLQQSSNHSTVLWLPHLDGVPGAGAEQVDPPVLAAGGEGVGAVAGEGCSAATYRHVQGAPLQQRVQTLQPIRS